MTVFTKLFQTAGITIQLNSDYPISAETFHPKFKLFETDQKSADTIVVNHHFFLPAGLQNTIRETQPLYKKDHWIVYKTETSWIYQYSPLVPQDPGCFSIGRFSLDHTVADIFAPGLSKMQYQNARLGALTLFNTDQVLFAKLLCDRSGFIIHANGFAVNGKGVLFAGDSGGGKTTLSHMLQKKGLTVLCDDRMFVTQSGDNFRIHGNWCHGTEPKVSNQSAPLDRIFFLKKSTKNRILEVNDSSAKTQLLFKSTVKAFLDSNDWKKTLSCFERVVRTVKCCVLEFNLSGQIHSELIQELSN